MLNANRIRSAALYLIILSVVSVLIYVPGAIGLADNFDFDRTLNAFGLSSLSGINFWSAEFQYGIANPASVWQYFRNIFLPVKDNPQHYYSTQFIFTKIALFLNALVNKLTHHAPGLFHLVFQTVQYIMIYSISLFLFLKEKWRDGAYADLAVKAVFAAIFLDCGYLVYFNSFFGEATTLIFLLLSFVLLLYLERNKRSYWVYMSLILSLFLFSGSKSANFPSALLLCIPLLFCAIKYEGLRKKIIICVSVFAMLLAVYSYVRLIPQWMKDDTDFQAVYFGVLYNNPSPAQAAEQLGLPRELSRFESMNAYNWKSLTSAEREETIQTLFQGRLSQADIIRYYFAHPAFFAQKLDTSAEASLPLRPTYLTNIHLDKRQADLLFDDRLNIWESIRKQFSGHASLFLCLILILSVVNLAVLLRRKTGLYSILLRLALLGASAGQFVVPMLKNGNADLQKHMFLFNVHVDILIILLLLDNLDFKSRIFRRAGIAAILFLFAIALHSSKPQTLSFGRIDGKPIEWYVLEERGDSVKVIAKDALYVGAYDDSSNDYTTASIHDSLNERYKEWFSQEERNRIQKEKYTAICSDDSLRQADAGDRPHYFFSPIKYADQDSHRAFRNSYSAYLALPSVDDVKLLFDKFRTASVLPVDYWLSTPYYSSADKARIVSSDYQVYHRKVNAVLGVRPVMWVKL
ncbi:DUF6273 domain-containing protein [Paenibacillus sp. HB172176]|uniref:glycan biosynthesis hexose transferase WsfD n=1 Tax=Paenibacillus sp. HB172176 TaxID=2493690 RepID=UPI00143A6C81|nr:DUF6273 domain-containing protein [Paenibacillus sp. HB172176]